MARASYTKDIPQMGFPVGSQKEVEDLAGPNLLEDFLRNVSTCSRKVERVNRGCPRWQACDRDFRGTRPQNQIVEVIGQSGDVRVVPMTCFDAVKCEQDAEGNDTSVRVVGGEGQEYTYRGSEKTHPTRDPNCNDCAQGKCEKYHDRNDFKALCEPFPAAKDHPELRRFARRLEARQRTVADKRTKTRAALLGGEDEIPEKEQEKEQEKPRFGRGARS